MNPNLRPLAWTLVAVALSALTAHLVAKRTKGAGAHTHSHHSHHHHEAASHPKGDALHDWLHEKLEITPEQESRLAPFEAAYAQSRESLLARSETAGRQLSEALVAKPTDREGIESALSEIHLAQGELQRLTIAHFLEMKDHLSPEQAGQLLHWTRASILHEHQP